MQAKYGKPSGSAGLKAVGVELSREARVRLSWMDFYRETKNVALSCRRFEILRQLRNQNLRLSTSMVCRILTHLKQRGRLGEAPRTGGKGSRRALRVRPYAVRKPKQYAVSAPGDLVEVDTMDVRPVPGMAFKQFTARDPIRALQVDGGSEFAAEFEQACQQRGLHLFVLPPHSPKLNGAVERANRNHTEEFYQVRPNSLELKKLNRELRAWERTYNTVRPHQALAYLTPFRFLQQLSSQRKE